MSASVVIVGAGQAGFQTAASLRLDGFDGPITLIGEERHLPYQRPPLSKAFLAGKQTFENTQFRPRKFYDDHRVDLLLGERVREIDRAQQRVVLASGSAITYGKLVLATGARVRKLQAADVHYLRDLDDAIEIRRRLDGASSVAIVGGGFIGLEVASVARAEGKSVTVREARERLMPRCVAPVISEFFREVHVEAGVNIVLNAPAMEIPRADLVLAGIGVEPNTGLAQAAGLAVANGIATDEYLRTEDENIFAIGDCSDHPNIFAGGRARLESVQNAADQAKCVAAQIAGRREAYRAVPWFWTDQFDIKLQMAGISSSRDEAVVRGSPASRKFSVFYFRGGQLAAVDSINRPADHMLARKLLAAEIRLAPAQAADESFDLKSLTAR